MKKEDILNLEWQRKQSNWVWEYDVIVDLIRPGSKILDVGCGDGVLGERLIKTKRCDVTGVDISEEAVKQARLSGLEAMVGDIEKSLDFADDSFDYAILCNVLEHLVDPVATLKESLRVSQKGVIISIPNFAVFPARVELAFGHFPRVPLFGKKWYNSQHIRLFSYKDFKYALNELNFGVQPTKEKFQPFYVTPILKNRLPNPLASLCVRVLGKVDNFAMKILAKLLPNLFALLVVMVLEKAEGFSIDKIKGYDYDV